MRRSRPHHRGPDQRYLRSRGNRRVRKARRTRSLVRWTLILVIHGTVLAILAHTVARALDRLRSSPEFAVERIELEGVHRASLGKIRASLAPWVGRNLIDLDLDRVEREVRRDPWVRRATVRRALPRTLQVKIEERTAAGLALIDGRAYVVDTTGFVIGSVRSGLADSLPVLTGLDGREPAALAAALERGAGMLERLRRTSPAFAGSISELDLSPADRIVMRTLGGDRLWLDPEQVDRNLLRYLELRKWIDSTTGTTDYIDLRWGDRIAVMPSRRVHTGEDG